MQPTVYQKPELRDANDNIIQQGAFGKNTALCNATNNGWIDYVMNNLEFLYGIAKDEVVPVPSLPASGQTNKTYLLTTTGVSYRWSGTEWVAVSSSEAVGRAEAAANLAEQWATKTDGTVDGTEYSAKYYAEQAEASADDAQDTADDMADHLVQIDKNTGGVAKNSKRISNIEKLLQGNLYDYQTDTDSAYTKTVPQGAMSYASLDSVGGKTLVWNQYLDRDHATTFSSTYVSYDSATDTYTVTYNEGSTYSSDVINIPIPNYQAGHKYYTYFDADLTNYVGMRVKFPAYSSHTTSLTNVVANHGTIRTGGTYYYFAVSKGSTETSAQSLSFRVKCCDLTLMYGAGNEPSTVAEFLEDFPNFVDATYNAGTLLSAGVTEVVSKDSNNATLQTYSIPASIQALEGYGWSAGTAYNYIDFERKVFVKRVGRVDLGTQNWKYNSTYSLFYTTIRGGIVPSSSYGDGNGVCPAYATVINAREDLPNKSMCVRTSFSSSSSYGVTIKDDSYEGNATNFKNALNGVYLYYPLATPVETDISQYLTDNIIEVGAGGTLTFPNANGDDYHIPVPSEVTYMIDLQEAVSNG